MNQETTIYNILYASFHSDKTYEHRDLVFIYFYIKKVFSDPYGKHIIAQSGKINKERPQFSLMGNWVLRFSTKKTFTICAIFLSILVDYVQKLLVSYLQLMDY